MCETNEWHTRVPISISDFNSFYLHSSTSLVNILPYPHPKAHDHHAIIFLIKIAVYAFAFQKDIKLTAIPQSENERVQPEMVLNAEDAYAFHLLLEKAELKLSNDNDT
jgi:hypothetical protein